MQTSALVATHQQGWLRGPPEGACAMRVCWGALRACTLQSTQGRKGGGADVRHRRSHPTLELPQAAELRLPWCRATHCQLDPRLA